MSRRQSRHAGASLVRTGGAPRFRWYGQVKRPLALVAAIVACVAALTAGTSALSAATPARLQLNYMRAIPSASGSLTGPNDQHLTLRRSACATT